MKILITGSDGFVGRHFVRELEPSNELTLVDLKRGIDCRDFFRDTSERFDLVIHLAAIVGGRETIDQEPLSVASDLAIDSDFFNWAVSSGQPRLVYFSSSAAYPISLQAEGTDHMLREDDIDLRAVQNPDMTYGWAKLTGEYLAQFARKAGTAVHVLRPFSGYGWDQDSSYPFPAFIDRVLRKENPFEIWGSGHQVRDFIHIRDVVQATMKVVESDVQVPVNLGSGVPTSFIELAEEIFKVAGWRPKGGIRPLPGKPTGVHFRCADTAAFSSLYKPKISLREGIAEALELRGALL